MCKQKDRCIVADAAGDVENYTVASIRLRRQKDIYESLCKAADSYTQYERQYVAGYNRSLSSKSSHAVKVYKQMQSLVGMTTSQGITIAGIRDHLVGRSIQRNIKQKDIKAALTNPLDYGKIKTDTNGNRSIEYTGTNARVIINPDTENTVSVWQTSTKIKKKYGVI